ncbi:hypothetical protein NQ318_008656 [Aromia moschata]|uniref:Lateral signaling target protein 2 homolog n=1 Tax=Aromia moschata TaxID=1265417 RepID=A0AAV8XJG0_9CUCU|nr:hypothetical protein NQ318_008656 [Aromia moschata]
MRPLAKAVTKSLENVRNLLREACLRNNTPNGPIKLDSNELVTEMLLESLKIFDRLFAEFELAYVSAMVPVKSTQEYELQELIGVLEMIDDCDPALMFTIPRLAIVSGLLIFPNGPLCIDRPMEEMSEMFRPFRTLLLKIRELLWTLDKRELYMLEKLLCDNEQIGDVKSVSDVDVQGDVDEFIGQFYDYPVCSYSGYFHKGDNDVAVEPESVQRSQATDADLASTSGYLISNSIVHGSIVASNSHAMYGLRLESPPDHDSLEVISVAAATLSSILARDVGTNSKVVNGKQNGDDLESPNDSGISTETTSLDRSPSLDLTEARNCGCAGNSSSPTCCCYSKKAARHADGADRKVLQAQADFSPGTSKLIPRSAFPVRKKKAMRAANGGVVYEDSSSSASSEASSFNSNCAEEIALAMQAAEMANRNEVRAKYRFIKYTLATPVPQ